MHNADIHQSWAGFAHSNHQPEDLYRMLRVLRVTLTDFHVFLGEIETIPFFRQSLKNMSVADFERVLDWLAQNASWNERLRHPELVPHLNDAGTRKLLQEFARNVLCIRELESSLKPSMGKFSSEASWLSQIIPWLEEAEKLSLALGISDLRRDALEASIQAASDRLGRIRKLEACFESLSAQTGVPAIERGDRVPRMMRAFTCIQRMPAALKIWRHPHIIDPARRLNLQTWKVRARPTLELRKELSAHFKFELEPTVENLKAMAEVFKQEGWFVHFKAPYRQTLKAYREMLRDSAARKKDSKESDFQRAERLLSWIGYYEQSSLFAANKEAQASFAPHFNGIDTDFNSAIDASHWAQKIQDEIIVPELDGGDPAFNCALLDFVRFIPEGKIASVLQWMKAQELKDAIEFVGELGPEDESAFSEARRQAELRLAALERLSEIAAGLGLAESVVFSSLRELRERSDEILFLVRWMDHHPELRGRLKAFYAGPATDLQALEDCSSYVRHIRRADLPEAVKNVLLSAKGVHFLEDSRPQLDRCYKALSVVKENYAKLEVATHGRIQTLAGPNASLESVAVDRLVEQIQNAIRQPQFFTVALSQLKQESSTGLTVEMPPIKASSTAPLDV